MRANPIATALAGFPSLGWCTGFRWMVDRTFTHGYVPVGFGWVI